MWRTLFMIAAVVALLASVSLGVMWVRSYVAVDDVSYDSIPPGRLVYLTSSNGTIFVAWCFYSLPTPKSSWRYVVRSPEAKPGETPGWRRFEYLRYQSRGFWMLGFPHWLPIALLSILPALWLAELRRRRARARQGRCPTCGYDLRATPDRCPECGTPAQVSA
jgi:hypothetical protein